jgi:hypothetical protein
MSFLGDDLAAGQPFQSVQFQVASADGEKGEAAEASEQAVRFSQRLPREPFVLE